MFHFLFRIIGGLVAAAVAGFGAVFIAAASMDSDSFRDRVGWVTLAMFVAAAVGFVWMFRRLGSGKWEERRVKGQIRKLQAQAAKRQIPQRAWLVSSALGGGSYATGTLRVSGDDVVSVDAAEGGAWRTVFTARWHPEVAGQEVASKLRPILPFTETRSNQGQYRVETKTVGHQPAWWEVVAYIPGDWEEELNRLWEAAKAVRLEGEKDRFGL